MILSQNDNSICVKTDLIKDQILTEKICRICWIHRKLYLVSAIINYFHQSRKHVIVKIKNASIDFAVPDIGDYENKANNQNQFKN
ncbi:hypothetical protein DERP_014320 [Dermatophagoides pteronyssinus]|uniref:Uncharacterized protein n=1 Tax=Dermatophagoides pteronyssinus TaxID=6956 RepID=A0ABQ8JXU9_DERPT|nr:hypothetical protein DERP_014320 [Dermatophagoides pteronyssinus]